MKKSDEKKNHVFRINIALDQVFEAKVSCRTLTQTTLCHWFSLRNVKYPWALTSCNKSLATWIAYQVSVAFAYECSLLCCVLLRSVLKSNRFMVLPVVILLRSYILTFLHIIGIVMHNSENDNGVWFNRIFLNCYWKYVKLDTLRNVYYIFPCILGMKVI